MEEAGEEEALIPGYGKMAYAGYETPGKAMYNKTTGRSRSASETCLSKANQQPRFDGALVYCNMLASLFSMSGTYYKTSNAAMNATIISRALKFSKKPSFFL